ncbi:MAG: threonine synthase [Candidatus Latescibacteria bacterium]|nr:threonine synthase [Candidatus Latescibacterota bacterium]
MVWRGVIERYREYLPVTEKTPVITLLEGNTPLIPAQNITKEINLRINLFFKYEGLNPTGSFKDRGMTVAVSKAVEGGAKAVMCASTGNTSASAAAYATRAGIRAVVLIPQGHIALGKLAQAMIEGAKVVAVKGNFDDALRLAKYITEHYPITLVNSINPHRIEGQKTAAFEICDHLGGMAPDYHILPVGNAGNITAYWKGYREYYQAGKSDRLPKILGFQAAGAAPIVLGHPVEKPETIATAIRIGNPASWKKAELARDQSGGLIDTVTDEQILEAYQMVARYEGIFCEPASAASVAGLIKLAQSDFFQKDETAVCVLTGHGLKDPDRAIAVAQKPVTVEAEAEAVLTEIGL